MKNSISDQASLIAKDILNTVASINEKFDVVHQDPRQALFDNQNVFNQMSQLVSILYLKITNHYEESPEAFQLAVNKKFTFPSRFKSPASLEVILCFTYKMISAYERNFLCNLINGDDHSLYAFKMQNGHVDTIKGLLKD
ncbi:MAG: hypothetical protein EOO43_01885 [Flavobacterium sp.]|nr:MAG: hypothetical protein EOO43_01885 [Flavobacterium sp.]